MPLTKYNVIKSTRLITFTIGVEREFVWKRLGRLWQRVLLFWFVWFYYCCFVWHSVLLHSPGWLWIHNCTESATRVQELQVCSLAHSSVLHGWWSNAKTKRELVLCKESKFIDNWFYLWKVSEMNPDTWLNLNAQAFPYWILFFCWEGMDTKSTKCYGAFKVSFKPMSKNHGLIFSGKENALCP